MGWGHLAGGPQLFPSAPGPVLLALHSGPWGMGMSVFVAFWGTWLDAV